MQAITHLEVHSHFTLLGGTAGVEELAARAAAEGLSHLALTDTNALYGAVAFARACRAAGVKPIIGMTATVAPPQGTAADGSGAPGRIVLLATNPAGYRSLCRLSSIIQGSPEREVLAARGLSWDDLHAHRDGLICLSGGRLGWVERLLRAGDTSGANVHAGRLASLYGDALYLSVEIHRPLDLEVARRIEALGRRLGVRAAAVQPIYCLSPLDWTRLRLLAAIDANVRLADVPSSRLPAAGDPNVDLHWPEQGEMRERFRELPAALEATAEVAARCENPLPGRQPVWPALDLPRGQSPDEALRVLAEEGLADRYGGQAPAGTPAGAQERLRHELDAIAGHGYAPIFLVVADIVRYARETGVPVSTRGSVANCLVAYCTGITSVDPIAHDLLFERFLNPARSDPPDIDLDFCSRRRDEVLDYVRRRYGPERVALVGTVSTLRPRGAVAETGKAYGLAERDIRKLANAVPHGWHPDPSRRDSRTLDEVLAGISDDQHKEVIRAAYGILGQPHHLSVHPGGVVITPSPLTDYVPVQWAPKGFLITQFDHGDVEAIGLPKMDLLGISALTVLADTVELVRAGPDPEISLEDIPQDDPATGAMLAKGETVGVFQCESEGAQRTLRQLRARNVRDLAVANAFFKPGPATGGMARHFVDRYRGKEKTAFQHPSLAPILAPTYGVLLFQEQILRIAREVAGLSWEQADHLRRGASHFGGAEMEGMHADFVAGCCRPAPDGPGFRPEQAERLFQQVMAFAGYGFNQGHATAYAEVSYRSAYLKAHWPAEFFCARLIGSGGFHHPAIYMAEAVRLGITVRPPHVNHSGSIFTLDATGQGALWMGLGQVRDLRQATALAIIDERRRGGEYAGVRDLLGRVPLQAREIMHLVRCGALDGLGESRAALLAEVEEVRRAGSAQQLMFGFGGLEVEPESATERFTWEMELLGLPVTVHPLDILPDPPAHVPLAQLPLHWGQAVRVLGARLPGWTGGDGFFLGDRETYVIVKGPQGMRTPPAWQTLALSGRWTGDEWGGSWLEVGKV